jgi:hypothetical protein
MTLDILSPADTKTGTTYRLPEEHRQAILAQSSSSVKSAQIERQRLAFIARNGSAFGDVSDLLQQKIFPTANLEDLKNDHIE